MILIFSSVHAVDPFLELVKIWRLSTLSTFCIDLALLADLLIPESAFSALGISCLIKTFTSWAYLFYVLKEGAPFVISSSEELYPNYSIFSFLSYSQRFKRADRYCWCSFLNSSSISGSCFWELSLVSSLSIQMALGGSWGGWTA